MRKKLWLVILVGLAALFQAGPQGESSAEPRTDSQLFSRLVARRGNVSEAVAPCCQGQQVAFTPGTPAPPLLGAHWVCPLYQTHDWGNNVCSYYAKDCAV